MLSGQRQGHADHPNLFRMTAGRAYPTAGPYFRGTARPTRHLQPSIRASRLSIRELELQSGYRAACKSAPTPSLKAVRRRSKSRRFRPAPASPLMESPRKWKTTAHGGPTAGTGPAIIWSMSCPGPLRLTGSSRTLGPRMAGRAGRAPRALRRFATCSLGYCPSLRRRGVGPRWRICRSRRRDGVRCLPWTPARRRRPPGTAGCARGRWSAQRTSCIPHLCIGAAAESGPGCMAQPTGSQCIHSCDRSTLGRRGAKRSLKEASARWGRVLLGGGRMAKSAGAGAPPQKAAHMTDRTLEWMSYRRSGKIGRSARRPDWSRERAPLHRRRSDAGTCRVDRTERVADRSPGACRPSKGWRVRGGPVRRSNAKASR